jgi:YVTN family beta-propeller protein
MRTLRCSSLILALFIGISAVGAGPATHYAVLKKYTIGGEGGWDYLNVDSDTHRLYISRGTHVMVMDTTDGKVVGDIPNTPGVHGIAVAAKLGKGFISNGRDDSVTVFDLKTLKETARVKVGQNPDAIMYDAASGRVFTFNGRSSDTTAIDAKTNAVAGTIALGGKPEFAQADGTGTVFVNIEDKSEIVEFNSRTLKIAKRWSLAPGEEPSGLAFDVKGHRLFSTCANNILAVSDSVNGKVVGSPKIGDGPDAGAFDAKMGLAFSSNGSDGTLTVVRCGAKDSYSVVEQVTTQKSARTMTLDAKTHMIFLIAADFDAPEPGSRRGKMKPGSATILVVGPTK